jgi:hypothetical protein
MTISARYWRLLAADTSWNTTWGIYHWNLHELELYSSSDASGTKLAVSASTASATYSTYYPSKAFDGNPSTFWATPQQMTYQQWIQADMGSAVSVASFKIVVSANASGLVGPKKLSLLYSSDGTTFTTLATVDVANTTIDRFVYTFGDLQASGVGRPLIRGGLLSRPPQFGGLLIRGG